MAQKIIGIFDSSCPSGWTRLSAFDNRFPIGKNVYGATGGSSTHTHEFDANSVNSTTVYSGEVDALDESLTGIDVNHQHSVAAQNGIVSTAASNLPAYIDVIFCYYNENFSSPYYNYDSGDIYFFDDACPSGWTRVSAFDDKFFVGALAYGGSGGGNHTHSFDPTSHALQSKLVGSSISTTGSGPNTICAGGSGHNHYFNRPASTSSAESALPPWIGVIMCKKN